MNLTTLVSCIFLALAWVLPNHYLPWTVFWNELLSAMAFSVLLVAGLLSHKRRAGWSVLSLGLMALALVPVLQWIFGHIHFAGDAWVAALYLLGVSLAVTCPKLDPDNLQSQLAALAVTTLLTAVISVGLALCQWLSLDYLGVFLVSMPQDARPFANLAQPNHLATLLMLGVVSALALHQFRQLGNLALWFTLAFLLFGVAMTQSRTAWLEVGGLLLWMLLKRSRATLRLGRGTLIVSAVWFYSLAVLWPVMCDAIFLTPGRALPGQLSGEIRLPFWISMVDAVLRAPWWGYGWNQVSVAQSVVALEHPAVSILFEHSHNIILDLVLWNGLPVGLMAVAGLGLWFWRQIRACRDPSVALLLGGIGVVVVHGMLEFPLEYTYFLLPVGFMMGAIEVLSPVGPTFKLPGPVLTVASAVAIGLLGWTAIEYFHIEEENRQLRFELAGYRGAIDAGVPHKVVLLTQLSEFPRFARTQAARNMSDEQLDRMRKMAERFGYPPVLFRYALAAGLNGRIGVAEQQLALLCKIQSPERCVEGIEAWESMAKGSYPELASAHLPRRPAKQP